MTLKEKGIGIILIVVGALPFLLKVNAIKEAIPTFLTGLIPGEAIYQGLLVILGLLLFFSLRPRT